ncbi:LEA type 2 family protein [Thermococcus zilligii]|uniref:LEA type 2 family protein n=1 Tax=Thermococcus zilligii TaxID=54076 RepID=UPI00029B0F95|nr:LEA type 2 family protein [Thermococcus zilligii]
MGKIAKLFGIVFLLFVLWLGYVGYSVSQGISGLHVQWGPVSEERTSIEINGSFKRPLYAPVSLKDAEVIFMNETVAKLSRIGYSPTSPEFNGEITIFNGKMVDAILKYLENNESGEMVVKIVPALFGILSTKIEVPVPVEEKILESIHLTAESYETAGIPGAKTPELRDTIVRYDGREEDKAVFSTVLVLYNPNPYPILLAETSYRVWVNGIEVALGEGEGNVVIPAGGTVEVPVKTYVNVSSLPRVWALHVENGEESTIKAKLYLRIRLDIPLVGARTEDVELTTIEKTVKTDIMGQINSSLPGPNT